VRACASSSDAPGVACSSCSKGSVARPGSAPEGTSATRLEREARRRARIDPELHHADFVIHPDMGFATRPTPAFFRMARQSGEREAQRLLPQLKAALHSSRKF
jgi:NTE family protein